MITAIYSCIDAMTLHTVLNYVIVRVHFQNIDYVNALPELYMFSFGTISYQYILYIEQKYKDIPQFQSEEDGIFF